MEPVDLAISPGWIVPVEPAGTVLSGHTLLVRDGTIVDLLPIVDALRRFAPAEHVERPGHLLLPGLVNAHTHAAMTLFRGLADDLPLNDWLERHIWPAEGRWVSPDFVRHGTELAALEMIRSGTTCFSDMYYFPDVVGEVAAELGLRACVGMIVIEQPTPWAATIEEYFSKGLAVHDRFREHASVTTGFAPHAPYTVSDASLRQIRVLADELDCTVQIHLHETAFEIAQSMEQHQARPIERLDRLGLLGPQLLAIHMTQVTDGDLGKLAESGATVIHCPESNMKLASGLCPVGRLLAAGVNVALGTDGAASNNDLDMLGEMRSAALLGKLVADDPTAVTAEDALRMATLNGARALGLGDRIGSLVPGKRADLVCVNLDALPTQPVYHPLSQLVYSATRDQVSDVWVDGRRLLDRGEPTCTQARDVVGRAATWAERIRS
ncbi:MAG: TRZ/ATZ family hydrolase [Chromatiales bacterium]|nr:TRZ/ATZ family hydrolase [Chromatiales bacterium]